MTSFKNRTTYQMFTQNPSLFIYDEIIMPYINWIYYWFYPKKSISHKKKIEKDKKKYHIL